MIGRTTSHLVRRWLFRPVVRIASAATSNLPIYVMHIDVPADRRLQGILTVIEGWALVPNYITDFSLSIAGVKLVTAYVSRRDATPLLGDRVRGFRAIADLQAIVKAAGHADACRLDLQVNGRTVASKPLLFEASAVANSGGPINVRLGKREWVKSHAACPSCGSATAALRFHENRISCDSCGAAFADNGTLMDFLPDDLKREFRVDSWGDISAHAYDDVATEIIESVRSARGKVLDCGSGLRKSADETVICVDVIALPNVDVLAVNQKLPFADDVFDAVLSLNVLEHVTDPFACALELVRVLKPGGTLYCCIPFLQPEHGYPHHYFNATRAGLQQLFANRLVNVRHVVPRSGEPVWSLHWFLQWYAKELPEAVRGEFMKLRVEDILAKSPETLIDAAWAKQLSEDARWRLASTTAAVLRKPEL
jgi:ubiquinone/menaquinone biosynthesis C-methylase UbiE/ribosomal protein S27AE